MSHQKQATSRPGAMSLLDKYASINASIEDARKRIAAMRTQLESTNAAIEKLCEERNGMTEETESAKADASRIQFDLKEANAERNAKLNAKTRVEREFQMAKREYHETRRRMDAERMDFLERGREFRASCKRMRVAASILVLDGKFDHGERGIEATENATEVDLWRRLQHEESTFSEDGIDYDDTVVVHNASSVTGRQDGKLAQKKKSKKTDPEMERAEKDEKQSRQALIEAECGLHAMKNEHDDAVMKRNDRNQKLTQQRAQLERHRKEVEEFERELRQTKADILEANQLGKAFEKECTRRKQSRNASYSSQFNPPPEESVPDCNYSEYTTPSCNSSSRTHTPNSNTMRGSIQAGYNQPTNGRAYGNSNGVVSNPYKNNRAQNTYNRQSFKPPADASNGNYGMQNKTAGKPHRHQYASEMLNKISPEYTQEEGKKYATQHPHRGGHVRTQRQFGTAVSLSSNSTSHGTDNGLGDVVSTTSANVQYAESASRHVAKGMSATASADDFSDTSSSSSDDDIISFAIFGNKK